MYSAEVYKFLNSVKRKMGRGYAPDFMFALPVLHRDYEYIIFLELLLDGNVPPPRSDEMHRFYCFTSCFAISLCLLAKVLVSAAGLLFSAQ